MEATPIPCHGSRRLDAGPAAGGAQRSAYDPVFLDWIFWWYLATIELTDRLLYRQRTATPA